MEKVAKTHEGWCLNFKTSNNYFYTILNITTRVLAKCPFMSFGAIYTVYLWSNTRTRPQYDATRAAYSDNGADCKSAFKLPSLFAIRNKLFLFLYSESFACGLPFNNNLSEITWNCALVLPIKLADCFERTARLHVAEPPTLNVDARYYLGSFSPYLFFIFFLFRHRGSDPWNSK